MKNKQLRLSATAEFLV